MFALLALAFQSLALLVGGQGVVLLQFAEGRLRSAERVWRDRRAVATWVDADFWRRAAHGSHPGVVLPLLGPQPLGIATELPPTGVALAHGSSLSSGSGADSTGRRPVELAPEAEDDEEPWASATPVGGSSVAMPSGWGPSRGKTTPGWDR